MRREIISVIPNFVEGCLDRSQKNKLRYLGIARSSLMELEAQSEICKILEYWTNKQYFEFDEKRGEIAYLMYRYALAIKYPVFFLVASLPLIPLVLFHPFILSLCATCTTCFEICYYKLLIC